MSFWGRHFGMHFPEWKCLNFKYIRFHWNISLEVQLTICQHWIRRQAILWIDYGLVCWVMHTGGKKGYGITRTVDVRVIILHDFHDLSSALIELLYQAIMYINLATSVFKSFRFLFLPAHVMWGSAHVKHGKSNMSQQHHYYSHNHCCRTN